MGRDAIDEGGRVWCVWVSGWCGGGWRVEGEVRVVEGEKAGVVGGWVG